jgi:hypothetical protein
MDAHDSSFSLLRLPKPLLMSLLWALLLHMFGLTALLTLSAGFYLKTVWDQSTWLIIGGWSMLILYVLTGLGGGIAAGLLFAAHRVVDAVESALHAGLRRLPALTETAVDSPSLDEADARYTDIVNRVLNQTLRYLPLPAWLERLIRLSIHDAIVSDFIAVCRERGLTRIPSQEFRNWALAKGATLALSTIHDQIAVWQYAVFGIAGFLAAGALLLAYLAS